MYIYSLFRLNRIREGDIVSVPSPNGVSWTGHSTMALPWNLRVSSGLSCLGLGYILL